MKTFNLKLLMFLSPLVMSGCASLGPKFETLQRPPKDRALIYFYRPSALTGSIQSPDIKVDGKILGTSHNGSFFYSELNPGLTKIVLVNFAGEELGDVEPKLIAGRVYFLRLDLGLKSLSESIDSNGKSSGKKCMQKVVHFASIPSSTLEILNSMDIQAQTNSCWPGFMFVTEDYAQKELPQTKMSK